jgi:cyanophycinase
MSYNPRMRRRRILLALGLGLAGVALSSAQARPAEGRRGPGPVIAVGGGGTTDAIVRRTLELAGGANAIVVVLPQASAESDGTESAQMWRDAGARDARVVDFGNATLARAALESATLIWIPGGDQNRFMKAVAGTGLDHVIRERHRAGVAVGGTSAGAAVLSKVMITGDADLESLGSGKTVTAEGLGIWPDVIVDQHFLRRQRHNRLISLVLDRPALVGVGIDEGTAAILVGTTISVVGRSAVMIVDARSADIAKAAPGESVAGRNVKVTILRDGMSVSLR